MESKYKERAKELCSTLFEEPCNWEDNSIESDFLILMCQLAEEVEKVYRDPLMFGEEGSIQRVYTKAYVEELLQKQRELSVEHATIDWYEYVDEEENFILNEKKVDPCHSNDSFRINENSILNAKLKIE
jgi:hypothetical protein